MKNHFIIDTDLSKEEIVRRLGINPTNVLQAGKDAAIFWIDQSDIIETLYLNSQSVIDWQPCLPHEYDMFTELDELQKEVATETEKRGYTFAQLSYNRQFLEKVIKDIDNSDLISASLIKYSIEARTQCAVLKNLDQSMETDPLALMDKEIDAASVPPAMKDLLYRAVRNAINGWMYEGADLDPAAEVRGLINNCEVLGRHANSKEWASLKLSTLKDEVWELEGPRIRVYAINHEVGSALILRNI